jgi:signal peptidase I
MKKNTGEFIKDFFLDTLESVIVSFAFFLIVYIFFMQPHQVSGHSMDHNFQDGQYVLTDKVSFKFRPPQRGEVIVFHAPKNACPNGLDCDFIKRIVALPKESINIQDNKFYVNGQLLDETYIPDSMPTIPGTFMENKTITLKENEYFVSGDNRTGSSDSRFWGPIKVDNIVGRVFFSYWPTKHFGLIDTPAYK